MHDAGFMRGHQAGCHITDDPKSGADRELAFLLQHGREIRPLEIRHRDVLDAVDFPEVVNADDVLVGDLAREDQFLLEPPLHFARGSRIARRFRANHFQCDVLPQLGVPDVIDGAHAADTQHSDGMVAGAKRLADGKRSGVSPGRSRERGRRWRHHGTIGIGGRGHQSGGGVSRRADSCDVVVGESDRKGRLAGPASTPYIRFNGPAKRTSHGTVAAGIMSQLCVAWVNCSKCYARPPPVRGSTAWAERYALTASSMVA